MRGVSRVRTKRGEKDRGRYRGKEMKEEEKVEEDRTHVHL